MTNQRTAPTGSAIMDCTELYLLDRVVTDQQYASIMADAYSRDVQAAGRTVETTQATAEAFGQSAAERRRELWQTLGQLDSEHAAADGTYDGSTGELSRRYAQLLEQPDRADEREAVAAALLARGVVYSPGGTAERGMLAASDDLAGELAAAFAGSDRHALELIGKCAEQLQQVADLAVMLAKGLDGLNELDSRRAGHLARLEDRVAQLEADLASANATIASRTEHLA